MREAADPWSPAPPLKDHRLCPWVHRAGWTLGGESRRPDGPCGVDARSASRSSRAAPAVGHDHVDRVGTTVDPAGESPGALLDRAGGGAVPRCRAT
jgi:hypothetical protein